MLSNVNSIHYMFVRSRGYVKSVCIKSICKIYVILYVNANCLFIITQRRTFCYKKKILNANKL